MHRSSQPPDDLAPFVRLLWGAAGPAADGARERVVPDGCCELIVHFGAPFREVGPDGRLALQPRAFLYGQLESAMLLAPGAAGGFVAVRFHPAGVAMLLGIDPRALGGVAVPLDDLFGPAGTEVTDRILAARSIEQGWTSLIAFLRRAARPRAQRHAAMLARLCERLARPGASVARAARELSSSTRSVERRFNAGVGLTPRQYVRIARVAAAARLLRAQPQSFAGVAHAAGYADQSHLSREFRALVGVTPGAYLRELGREDCGIVP